MGGYRHVFIRCGRACRFGKWRERRNRVDKDVHRTDRSHQAFSAEASPNITALRNILLTYGQYNFDLGYCQVSSHPRLQRHAQGCVVGFCQVKTQLEP